MSWGRQLQESFQRRLVLIKEVFSFLNNRLASSYPTGQTRIREFVSRNHEYFATRSSLINAQKAGPDLAIFPQPAIRKPYRT